MPRLLSPYENTPNAALWNARGQITRRQFEMLVEPETPMTRMRLRRQRLLILVLGAAFTAWWALHELWRTTPGVSESLVVSTGGLLLAACVLIVVTAVFRLIWEILAIMPTSEEIGESLRKRIRAGALSICSVEGRLQYRHLSVGRSLLLCSVVVGGHEFPISQSLWEMLQEQPRAGRWTLFYLRVPSAVLSICRSDELKRGLSGFPGDEAVVSGDTIARRADH